MTALERLVSSILSAATKTAESEGFEDLADKLHAAGYLTDEAFAFIDEHPAEAIAGFIAGVVALIYIGPEALAAGARILGQHFLFKGLAELIGGDAATIVSAAALEQIAQYDIDHATKTILQEASNFVNYLAGENIATYSLDGNGHLTVVPQSEITETPFPSLSLSEGSVFFEFEDGTSAVLSNNIDGSATNILYNADGTISARDVERPDGTSSLTSYNSDGSTVTTNYTGLNGSGILTSMNIENIDGTSIVTIFNPDGSSTSITFSGPNGAGAPTFKDAENADGTSSLTTYNLDGSSVVTTYKGPNGTGTVVQVETFDRSGNSTLSMVFLSRGEMIDFLPGSHNTTVISNGGRVEFSVPDASIPGATFIPQIGSSDGNIFLSDGPFVISLPQIHSEQILLGGASSELIPGFLYYVGGQAVTGQIAQITYAFSVACYAVGTRILTLCGQTPIEKLTVGDLVWASGVGFVPVSWIWYRNIDCRHHLKPEQVWPVRVRAGAFGTGQPHRDLWLSPDHAVYMQTVLIPIKHLINGTTIKQMRVDAVTYYHIELPQHGVILAEGLPCESYLDTGDRSNFADSGGVVRLFPDFSPPSVNVAALWEAKGYAPLVVCGPELEAARALVNAQTATISSIREATYISGGIV